MTKRIAMLMLAATTAANAQFPANAGFETGVFTPWTVTNTAAGTSVSTGIAMYDIDGSSGLPLSRAASFMVGRSAAVTTPQGVELSQVVDLLGGIDLRLTANWSVFPLVNVYNAAGGTFELLVDGQVIGQATAPVTVAGQATFGTVSGSFHPAVNSSHMLTVRITRNIPAGEEVFQYVDNVYLTPACYPNCDFGYATPILTANDFQCFLNQFASGRPYANCDGSTASPLLTANDFQCFLNAYASGCN